MGTAEWINSLLLLTYAWSINVLLVEEILVKLEIICVKLQDIQEFFRIARYMCFILVIC